MPLSTSDYVTVGTAIVGVVITIAGSLWVAKRQRKRNAIFEASNRFKSVLTEDLPNYVNDGTTFSACILELYPKHKAALDQLFIHLPESKKERISTTWEPYERLYKEKKALGVVGAISAELPHPDFDPSLKNVQHIERKRKKQVAEVLNEVRKML